MTSLKAQLLLAAPTLLDPNFMQTIVIMVQHDDNGALGLVLNRPTQMSIKEAWEQVSDKPCAREDVIHVGGPCEGVLMALHNVEELSQIQVLPGLHFTTDTQYLEKLVQREEPDTHVRFFVGYSGWSAGQLENEMEAGSWQVAPATVDRIFATNGNLWQQIKREIALSSIMGKVNPKLIPGDPGNN